LLLLIQLSLIFLVALSSSSLPGFLSFAFLWVYIQRQEKRLDFYFFCCCFRGCRCVLAELKRLGKSYTESLQAANRLMIARWVLFFFFFFPFVPVKGFIFVGFCCWTWWICRFLKSESFFLRVWYNYQWQVWSWTNEECRALHCGDYWRI